MARPYLLHHLLEEAAAAVPSSEALVDLVGARRSFDYETFLALVVHCVGALQGQGLERGDRVAVYLPKSAEEAVAIFAATMAGGVFVIINSLLLGHQAEHILRDCGAKYLITSKHDWGRIRNEVAKVESL